MTAENSGRLTLEGRKKLTLTGAKEVLRFDEELVELVKQLNRELPLHFPKEAELRVLKEKLMARRKQLID